MVATTFTGEDLATLERAIASGTLTVEYAGYRHTYHSIAELIRARDFVARKLAEQSAGNRKRTSHIRFS